MVKNMDGFFALSAQQSVHMRGGLGEDLAPELEQVDILTMPHHVSEKCCTLPVCHSIPSTFMTSELYLRESLGLPPELLSESRFYGQGLLSRLPST